MTLLLLYEWTEGGAVIIAREGHADGISNAQAYSAPIIPAVGNADGISNVTAISPHVVSAVGNADGIAIVHAQSDYVIGYTGEDFLPTTLKLEFQKSSYNLFTAIKIQFPLWTMHVLDSSGIVGIDGVLYSGSDPELGTILSLDVISDGTGDEAPTLRIVIQPPDSVASQTLLHEYNQGSVINVYIGAVDLTTGQTIGYQEVFLGEVDQSTLEVDENLRQLTLDCVSVFERFFDDDEGTRLTDAWHQSIWPGEQGLVYVTDIERQIPWGADAPLTPPITAQSSSSSVYKTNFGYLNMVKYF